MDDNGDAKRILSTLPPEDWRRPRGRPCITCLSTIQQDLRSHNLTLSINQSTFVKRHKSRANRRRVGTTWSNGYSREPVSVEDVVDVWRNAILKSCSPETMMTTNNCTIEKLTLTNWHLAAANGWMVWHSSATWQCFHYAMNTVNNVLDNKCSWALL